ncbi:GMC family oxidoreductase [Arenibacterium halophilum]|uniref:Glucose-methanol-choline oxidoreductase n=1 Tax=Arenibacterium halophilum TaxID=2583821 RepID=A0ABY2X0V5_9RHOB|nr:GMC family oxidoreductase N-terminal domain-containing protein [Arenibacterium halophilum]TMV08268.1 glucose-methanol-choline oxidoreductase [Arenibacterium halophilum]
MRADMESWDYIVVGSGAAGSVVAARLSEDPGNRVLVLEAGGSDRNPLFRVPGLGFAAGAVPRYNWNFATQGIEVLGGRSMTILQGRVLGGSSSMNGMVYTRGHRAEYDRWAEMGCEGWGFDDLHPYFRKSEANWRAPSQMHGTEGPVRLRRADPRLPICDAFLEAAGAHGIEIVEDLNADHAEGLGWYDVNIDRGLRLSAPRAYLYPALDRDNLSLLTNTQVTRVVIEGGRATGVEAVSQGQRVTFHATCEVILCAGAVMSPKVLMLSGVGPADSLRQHGIAVVADSPSVGANFQNHPCYRPQWLCSEPVTARRHVTALGAAKAGVRYLLSRTGPLAESFASAGGFFKSDPSLDLADMQVVMLSALPAGGGARIRDLLPQRHGFGFTIYQGTPYSRGRVSLGSADPMAPPVVETGYFSDPRDLPILAAGVERIREIVRRPEIAKYVDREIAPGPSVDSRGSLIEAIRAGAGTSYHQCGTCAFGPGETAPLDLRLRVNGVAGLRVADTSVMPVLPNAALHAPTMMIGEKAAALILEDA